MMLNFMRSFFPKKGVRSGETALEAIARHMVEVLEAE